MPKLTWILFATVLAFAGMASNADAAAQAKAKGKDRGTCTNLVRANPAYQGRGGGCTRACGPAIQRCMRGLPI